MGSLYSEHTTWLHTWSAARKLLVLTLLCGGWMVLRQGAWAAFGLVLTVLLWWSLGAATLAVRRLLRLVLLTALLVALYHTLWGRWEVALISAARLLGTFVLGMSLALTTRWQEVLDVMEHLLRPLERWGLPAGVLTLQVGLMLRFMEVFLLHWQRLDETYRLRTGRPVGWRLIPPLIVHLLQTARRVGDALLVRWER